MFDAVKEPVAGNTPSVTPISLPDVHVTSPDPVVNHEPDVPKAPPATPATPTQTPVESSPLRTRPVRKRPSQKLSTMFDRAKRLSSTPDLFAQECRELKTTFLKLKYPGKLIDSVLNSFHSSQDQNESCIAPADSPVRITLPFKDQKSADYVRRELCDLGKKIDREITPVFTSKKISEELKFTETKPSLVNQQSVVYEYKCNSCDANYIGYTSRHLHLRIEEHRYSVIGKHLQEQHNQKPIDLHSQFAILKKCRGKFEC
ncbi:hypothetical protein ACROYT_G013978 [Oculina patagonica]